MYAAIITDGKDEYSEEVTANCCVFADRMVNNKCDVVIFIFNLNTYSIAFDIR